MLGGRTSSGATPAARRLRGASRSRRRRLCLLTDDVQALERVAVAVRLVRAAVGHADHRLDAEIAVVNRVVAPNRRCPTIDVDAVVFRANGVIALEQSVGGGRLN